MEFEEAIPCSEPDCGIESVRPGKTQCNALGCPDMSHCFTEDFDK